MRDPNRPSRSHLVALVATAIVLGGCTGAPAPRANKAGGPPAALTISIGDSQSAGKLSNAFMTEFAKQVESLSEGAITVQTNSDVAVDSHRADDSRVIDSVEDGSLDLGVVPTRAWGEAGVESFDVFQLPFEITTNEQMAAVARDDDLIRVGVAGLDDVGVLALTLAPESLRYVFGVGRPITSLANLHDVAFRSVTETMRPYVEAMGARFVNPRDAEYAAGLADGSIGAMETDLDRAMDLGSDITATGNLVLYAKFTTIAANAEWWSDLDKAQRSLLSQAATATRERTILDLVPTASAASAFCDTGRSVVLADADAVAAVRLAVEPTLVGLDPTSVADLRHDVEATPGKTTPACRASKHLLDPTRLTPAGGNLPNGVYRIVETREFAEQWVEEHGSAMFGSMATDHFPTVFTWTMKDGRYTFEIAPQGETPFIEENVYQVAGHRMLFSLSPDSGGVVNILRWRVDDHGDLQLTQVDDLEPDPNYALTWERIGPA
ncbi:MAG: hypothetical protein ABIO16_14185 [Nocardioides sp.]